MTDKDDAEALRARIAELEARQSDSPGRPRRAGGGFAGGFFGCFGVLAAIVLCLVALTFCSALLKDRREARLDEGKPRGADFTANCASGLTQLVRAHPRLKGAYLDATDAVILSSGDMPLILCSGSSPAGSIGFSVQVICGDSLSRGCNQVRRADVNGREIGLP